MVELILSQTSLCCNFGALLLPSRTVGLFLLTFQHDKDNILKCTLFLWKVFMAATHLAKQEKVHLGPGRILLRILCVLLVTLLLLVCFLYGVMFLLCKGPSPSARDLFVRSVRETSAIGFLANLYLSEEEIAEIEKAEVITVEGTDTSLINLNTETPEKAEGPYTDAWGYVDDDGDGLILVNVPGETYTGYMMIVLDPSRVVLGCSPETLGGKGYTVEEYVEMFDAVAGINGGGFEDPNGQGNGSMPNSAIVSGGEIYCSFKGIGNGFVGLDENNILQVGFNSVGELSERKIRDGAGYGPVLVSNGESVDPDLLKSGLNPRTAIGQRSDGAVLMLVIDGRQPNSLGATYADEADIMIRFGAVNACNLDGGSSSLLWFEGKYVNNSASVIGIRPIPTSFVVLKEGSSHDS